MDDLLNWFKLLPPYENVYLLGCFAKRVTLYSQQVRALNLIAALVREGIIHRGREVVVIGGGAAGLTAAAGAAEHGAKVLLLEHFPTVMEPLRGNRQRWIHPFIYDWPISGSKEQNANLPRLNWIAGYAEQVVAQIEEQWKRAVVDHSIDVKCNIPDVTVDKQEDGVLVRWTGSEPGSEPRSEPGEKRNQLVILAVGFGFEPNDDFRYSYWTEDAIDGSFRKSMKGRWLVSGFGDGAFTDLMRLCLKDFRHARVADMFAVAGGIDDIADQLRNLSASNMKADELTQSFRALSLDSLKAELGQRLRPDIKVYLTGKHPNLYGSQASALNRLIVCVLEQLGAFEYLPGGTVMESIARSSEGISITVGKARPAAFQGVVIRHGPEDRTLPVVFPALKTAWSELEKKWQATSPDEDPTKIPQWQSAFPTSSQKPVQSGDVFRRFSKAVNRLGVRASRLLVSKVLRKDGSSEITYRVEDLLVVKGTLVGLKVHYESTLGIVGTPEFDADAKFLGVRWEPDPPRNLPVTDHDTSVSAERDRARLLSGMVLFPEPLTHSHPPISFGFTLRVLHADAMTRWEYKQMYSPQEQLRLNASGLPGPSEYMGRVVWFPIETLKLQVTLPGRMSEHAFPGTFQARRKSIFSALKPQIKRKEVIKDNILQMYPPRGSAWRMAPSKWIRQTEALFIKSGQFNISGQTAELSVTWPPVGSRYALDWALPETTGSEAELKLERQAQQYRNTLLDYRNARMRPAPLGPYEKVRSIFMSLNEQIEQRFRLKTDSREDFVVSLLTYDESMRRLRLADGVLNGGEPSEEMWKFWLPFGAGISGVCFKQADTFPVIYLESATKKSKPNLYLRLKNMQHKALVAFPLDHPEYAPSVPASDFETARQRIAVIDVGSTSEDSKLFGLKSYKTDDFEQLNGMFRRFCLDLGHALSEIQAATGEK